MRRTPISSYRARAFAVAIAGWLVGTATLADAGDRPEPAATTATIAGIVTDLTGQPLPGATVVVSSEVLEGDRAAVTEDSGAFTIADLPPGSYLVAVYYADVTWQRAGIEAAAGAVADVRAEIDTSAAYGEVITISGDAPVIDTTSVTHGVSYSGSTSLESEYTASIPVGRSFASVLGAAAGSTSSTGQEPGPSAGLLTAATVGDADRFGPYLEFLDRHDSERDALGLDPDRRVRFHVRDADGRSINDAAIVVDDGAGVYGRTHADGVWDYIPTANARGVVSVSVEAGGARTEVSVALPGHGHTDELDVQLAGAAGGPPTALDLAFAIDATGSMGDEMDYLSAELRDIVATIRDAVPGVSIRVGAVIYRDREDTVPLARRDFSTDVDAFVDWLATLSATGGGDTPEDMDRGLEEALTRLAWRDGDVARTLVVLADAPPQSYPDATYRYHDAIRDASARGIRLLPIAASSADRTVEYLFRAMGVYTSTPYVYLTDDSGIGNPHLEADTDRVTVEQLNALLVRLVVADLSGEGMHPPGDWASWGDYREPPWERDQRVFAVGASVGGGYLFDETFAHMRWARAGVAFGDLELRAQLGWSADLTVDAPVALKRAGGSGDSIDTIDIDMLIGGASVRYLFGNWRGVRAFTAAGLEILDVRGGGLSDTTHLFMSQAGAEWRASRSATGLAIGVQATSHLLIDDATEAADVAPLPPLELSVYADYRF